MKRHIVRAIVAALPIASSLPAHAETVDGPESSSDDPIVVTPVSLHPAAGLMNEHTHDGGEFMIGLRYTRSHHAGTNQSGTDTIADADILAAGYTVRAREMTMDMVMLDLMYAPNDKLTLMVMPHWMRHEMTMVGIDPTNTGMAMGMNGIVHAHHGLPLGETMTHSTQGMGDTLVSASYRLVNTPGFKAHATLGVWAPTGKVDRKNDDGTFVHYMMQSGSGTWDIEPSVTVAGRTGPLGWGVQASYRWRTESENESGFAFGDKATATGWISYLVENDLSLTSRLSWEHEGQILGHYNAAHKHSSPSDRQENYGGDQLFAGIGANLALPVSGRDRPQIGVEIGLPLYQDLNGIQLAEDWRASLSLSKTF
ncbi:MAG: hypothetical protein R3E14_04035 [Erythrobacter sp.]